MVVFGKTPFFNHLFFLYCNNTSTLAQKPQTPPQSACHHRLLKLQENQKEKNKSREKTKEKREKKKIPIKEKKQLARELRKLLPFTVFDGHRLAYDLSHLFKSLENLFLSCLFAGPSVPPDKSPRRTLFNCLSYSTSPRAFEGKGIDAGTGARIQYFGSPRHNNVSSRLVGLVHSSPLHASTRVALPLIVILIL